MHEEQRFEREKIPVSERKITLPDKEQMLQKLLAVDSNVRLLEVFYPSLLQRAGKEMGPLGYVRLFQIALSAFEKQFSSQERAVMEAQVPMFVDALIPDDKEFADFIKQSFN